MRFCERCKANAPLPKERYCKSCRKVVLKELEESGAITPVVYARYRSAEQMENIRETKYGNDR